MPKKIVKKSRTKIVVDKTLLRNTFWVVVGISLITFGALLIILRGTIMEISKDPSVNALTNEAAFNVVQIINRNKNKFENNLEGCWNQKNPNLDCFKENTIVEGYYALKGDGVTYWLEGPYKEYIKTDTFKLDPANVQETLGGFVLKDTNYYQILTIKYPESKSTMQIIIETRNEENDKRIREIEIAGYPLVLIKQNE